MRFITPFLLILLASCTTEPAHALSLLDAIFGPAPQAAQPDPVISRSVLASWYGGGETLNRHTASGEIFHAGALTAAHRSLPIGTRIRVRRGNRSVVVRINDRGPAASTGRSLDLSRRAAAQIGLVDIGVGLVTYQIVGR